MNPLIGKVQFGYTGYGMSIYQMDSCVSFQLTKRGIDIASVEMVIQSAMALQVESIKLAVSEICSILVDMGGRDRKALFAASGLVPRCDHEIWREVLIGITDHDMQLTWPQQIRFYGLPVKHLVTAVNLNESIPDVLTIDRVPLRVCPWTLTTPDGTTVWLGRQNNGSEQYLVTIQTGAST